MNVELSLLSDWLSSNKLLLNVDKTKHILFCTKAKESLLYKNKFILNIKNAMVSQVREFNFLGVVFQENLSWKTHAYGVWQKIRGQYGAIKKISKNLCEHSLNILYHSFLLSHVKYCIPVWYHGQENIFTQIQNLCDKFTRLTYKIKKDMPLVNTAKTHMILSVKDLYMCEVTSIMHNNVTNILPPCFSQFFTQNCNVHDFYTRSKYKFHIPQYTKAVSQQSLRYVGSKCWQSVPLAITSTIHTVSKHCFMKNVKKHLISQYYNHH